MAGMKLFTRFISSANSSSMRVPLVKQRNSSRVLLAEAMMSFLRTSGSPPV
jgi:hypothetical protein